MTENAKICFTCRKIDSLKYHNIKKIDSDEISLMEKLQTVMNDKLLEETHNMQICTSCIRHLRISYRFHMTVLVSQDLLKRQVEQQSQRVEFLAIKEEGSDSSDTLTSESDSGSSEFEESLKIDEEKDTTTSRKSLKRKKCTKNKRREPFPCQYCGVQFDKNWQLTKHLSRVHDDFRKFICTYCNKEFKQAFHLKEHMTSHTGEKNYTCPICDKKFQRQSSQKRHVKSHNAPPGHKTKRTPFLCTICGKNFPFSNGVQRHMRIHLGIKKFQCNLCSRKFTQSTHLQVHMRTHTGEKPYICDTCGEKFSLKSCMVKHMNNQHCKKESAVMNFPIFWEGFK